MTHTPEIDPAAFKQFENTGYSALAQRYNDLVIRATSQVNGPMLDALEVHQGTHMLDIPCGPGALAVDALARGASVIGMDISQNMVDIAQANCPQAEFRVGDAENLPFDDECFDVVGCSFGILHFPVPERAITETVRVLRTGGHYAFTCWLPPDQSPLMGLVIGSIMQHGTMNVGLPEGPPLFRFGDPAECEQAVTAAGMTFVSAHEVPVVYRATSPETFADEITSSTARLKGLFDGQTEEARYAIKAAIVQGAQAYHTTHGVNVPWPALLTLARKP